MTNPAKSLNSFVDWQQLLRLLDVPVAQRSLPIQTACPICQEGVLTIYEDFISDGQWFHCDQCGSNGDLIELASRVWKLNIEETVIKLSLSKQSLADQQAAVKKYQSQHIDYRKRLNQLWLNARDNMQQPSRELQRLIECFNLRCEVPRERWLAGPGGILGGIDTEQIERTLAPGAMVHADVKKQRCNPSEHATFHGPGWRDALVLPYYDLPGRICGFLFVGRDGKYPEDFAYRRANLGPRSNRYFTLIGEAGLAMHPLALEASNEWDRIIVATAKPMTGLALQMRHFEQSQQALPLVHWYDSVKRIQQHGENQRVKTINAWQMLGNRQVIFWMPEFCVATIQQAIAINGLISTVGPRNSSPEALQEFVWKFTPRDLLRHIIKSANPWPRTLSHAFSAMNNTTIEKHLRRMQVNEVNVVSMLAKCGNLTQRRVKPILEELKFRVAKLCTSQTIVERAGHWYERSRLGQESLICDATLRINTILEHGLSKTPYAKGSVRYKGKAHAFCEPLQTLQKQGMEWMQQYLIQKGCGCLNYHQSFRRRLVDLAVTFYSPKITTTISSVGWDDRQLQFVLPRFTFNDRGEVVHPGNLMLAQPMPASELYPPDICLTPEELDRCGRVDETTKQFWAVLGCMIANMTAPACLKHRAGIALVGNGAQQMAQALASALGCITLEIESSKDVRDALELEHVHGWPVLVGERRRLQRRFRSHLLRDEGQNHRNLIYAVDWPESRLLALGGKWNVVDGPSTVVIRPEQVEYAAKFVVAYIQELCKKRFILGRWQGMHASHVVNVLRDMARFVKEQGGNGKPIVAASKVILPTQRIGNVSALAELIAYWLRTRKLQVVAAGEEQRTPILTKVENGYFLACDSIKALTKGTAVDLPRFEKLTELFTEAAILAEAQSDGWTIDSKWMNPIVESTATPLRVVV